MSYLDPENWDDTRTTTTSNYVPEPKNTNDNADLKSAIFYSAMILTTAWTLWSVIGALILGSFVMACIVLVATTVCISFAVRLTEGNRIAGYFLGWTMALVVSVPMGLFGAQKILYPTQWNRNMAKVRAEKMEEDRRLNEAVHRRKVQNAVDAVQAIQLDEAIRQGVRGQY